MGINVVLIVIATDTEEVTMSKLLGETRRSTVTFGYKKCSIAISPNLRVIVEKLPAMGTLEAGVMVTHLIRQHKPLFVVGAGICAATSNAASPPDYCDLMIADSIVYYEPEKQMPTKAEWRPRLFPVTFPQELLRRLLPVTDFSKTLQPHPRVNNAVKFGSFGCGERVLADQDAVAQLRQRTIQSYNHDIVAIEMESGGIARACELTGTPFIVAKGVSDFGTEHKDDKWQAAAAALSFDSVLRWIQDFSASEIDALVPRVGLVSERDRLNRAVKTVRLAGGMIPILGETARESIEQSTDDFITNTDLLIGDYLTKHLEEPEIPVLVEESMGSSKKWQEGLCWVVDPLDGTRNLLDGGQEVAVSAALFNKGIVELAVIGLPFRSTVVSCTATGMVEVNDQPWLCARPAATSLRTATVAVPGDVARLSAEHREFDLSPLQDGNSGAGRLRISGALAFDLARLALGEIDARVSTSAKLVDVAAGVLLVKRSGGVVTDLDGEPWTPGSTSILAARTQELHSELFKCLHAGGARHGTP